MAPSETNSMEKILWTMLWWLFQVLVHNDYPVWLYANLFVFRDFNVHHKDWLTYSGGADRPSGPFFLSQTTLLRWLTFLLRSQTVILLFLLFWIHFFLLMLVFVLQWLCLHRESVIMLLSQFQLIFHQFHDRMSCFIV